MNLCVNVGKYILIANDVVGLLIVLVSRRAIPCPKAAIPIGLPVSKALAVILQEQLAVVSMK